MVIVNVMVIMNGSFGLFFICEMLGMCFVKLFSLKFVFVLFVFGNVVVVVVLGVGLRFVWVFGLISELVCEFMC